MGKFVGWKCDVCNNAEDGNDAPVDWLRLRLPVLTNGSGADNARDLCSDKCLLKFAKERAGVGTKSDSDRQKASKDLLAFLSARGVRNNQKGAMFGNHIRRRHEMNGGVDDCLVCEFLTMKEGE